MKKRKLTSSSSVYRFGDGLTFNAIKNNYQRIYRRRSDVFDSDIALLLSRASIKRANINLNFKDITSVFAETIDLVVTKIEHAFALTIPCRIVHKTNNQTVIINF